MIRKATSRDIDAILDVTKACAKHMISQNILQWNAHYPSREAFEKDLDRQELYVLETANTIVGCIVISTLMDDEYIPIHWLTPNSSNMYIHRLAVHPDYQGQGFATEMMTYAEDYSKKKNYKSVRLDTFSQNKKNQNMYESRGYKQLGHIFFPKQSEHPFYCYELVF